MASVVPPSDRVAFLHLLKTGGFSMRTALAQAAGDARSWPERGLRRPTGAACSLQGRGASGLAGHFRFTRNSRGRSVSGSLHPTRDRPASGAEPPDVPASLAGGRRRDPVLNPDSSRFGSPRPFVACPAQVEQPPRDRRGRRAPVAFLGRFEHIAGDWTRASRPGRDVAPPERNRSTRTHDTDRRDDETREAAARRDAPRIERFDHRSGT